MPITHWCTYLSFALATASHFNLSPAELKCLQKKIHFPNTCGKRYDTVKCEYGSQPSVRGGSLGNVVYQEDAYPWLAAAAPKLLAQDVEGAEKIVPSYVDEFAEVLMRVRKQSYG